MGGDGRERIHDLTSGISCSGITFLPPGNHTRAEKINYLMNVNGLIYNKLKLLCDT